MAPLLEAQGISKSYLAGLGRCWARVNVLRAVSLVLHAGERVLVTGNPGAGKTTLLHCLTGLRRPDAGSVRWQGGPDVPYRLCLDSSGLADGGHSLAIVDLPGSIWAAGHWMEVLHSNGAARRGWLVFARDSAALAPIADRVLALREGCLHELPRQRPRRVAEGRSS